MYFLLIYLSICLATSILGKKIYNKMAIEDYKALLAFDNNFSLKKYYKFRIKLIKNIYILFSPFLLLINFFPLLFIITFEIINENISNKKIITYINHKSDMIQLFFLVSCSSYFIPFHFFENKKTYKEDKIIENDKEYTVKHYINGTIRYFLNNKIHRESNVAVISQNWQILDFFIPDDAYYMNGKTYNYINKDKYEKDLLKNKVLDF